MNKDRSQRDWVLLTLTALAIGPFLRDAYLRVSGMAYFRYLSSPDWMIWLHMCAAGLGLVVGWLNLLSGTGARSLLGSSRCRLWHRWLGRIYLAGVVLGIAGGVALLFHVRYGGLAAKFGLGYGLILWSIFTTMMVTTVRQGRLEQHRRWALRSYAISLAGITLRVILESGIALRLPLTAVYAVATCSCFLINLLVVELLWVRSPSGATRS